MCFWCLEVRIGVGDMDKFYHDILWYCCDSGDDKKYLLLLFIAGTS